MNDDIEHLKIHKIQPDSQKKRVHLTQLGQKQADASQETEAFSKSAPTKEKIPAEILKNQIIEKLKSIFDPEIPVNIYDLGLIYDIQIENHDQAEIKMTLTAPACPVAGQIIQDVAKAVGDLPGISQCHVELVWDPPWTKARMTEAALVELGLF